MKDTSKSSSQAQGVTKGGRLASASTSATQAPEQKCTLADLCPQDKKKVAGLLQQVVDLGQEVQVLKKAKEQAQSEAEELKAANQRLAKENNSAKSKLSQMLMLLKAYQSKVDELTKQVQNQQIRQPQVQTGLQVQGTPPSLEQKQLETCSQCPTSSTTLNDAPTTAQVALEPNTLLPQAPAAFSSDNKQASQPQSTLSDKQPSNASTSVIPASTYTTTGHEHTWQISSSSAQPPPPTSSNSLMPLMSHPHSMQPLVSIPPGAHINITIQQQPCQHPSHADSATSAGLVHVRNLHKSDTTGNAGQPSAASDGLQQLQGRNENQAGLPHSQTEQQGFNHTDHTTANSENHDKEDAGGVTTPRANRKQEAQGREVVVSKDVLFAASSEPMEVTDVASSNMTPPPGMKLRGDVSSPLLVTPLGAGGAAAASLLQWQMRQGLIKGIDDKAVSQIIGGKVLRFDPSIGQHGAFLFADVPQMDLSNKMLPSTPDGHVDAEQQPYQQQHEQQEAQPSGYGQPVRVPTALSKAQTAEGVGNRNKESNSAQMESDALSDLTSELTLTSLPGTPHTTRDGAVQHSQHRHNPSQPSIIDQQPPTRTSHSENQRTWRDEDAMFKLAQRLEAPLVKSAVSSKRNGSSTTPVIPQLHARQQVQSQKPCLLPSSPLLAMPASSNNSPVQHTKTGHIDSRYGDDRLQNQAYHRPPDSKLMLHKDQDMFSGRCSPDSSPRLHTTLCVGPNDRVQQGRYSKHRRDDYNGEQPSSAGSVSYGSRVAGNSLAIEATCMLDMESDLMDIIMQVDADFSNHGAAEFAVETHEEHSSPVQPALHNSAAHEESDSHDFRLQTHRKTEVQHARTINSQIDRHDTTFGRISFKGPGTEYQGRMQQSRITSQTDTHLRQQAGSASNQIYEPVMDSGLARHLQQLDGHQAAISATLAAVQQSQLVEEQVQARLRASKPNLGSERPTWGAFRRQPWAGLSEVLQDGQDMSDDDSEAVLSILHEDM